MQDGMSGGMCSCPHHKMVPLFIVLIGLIFLLEAMGTVTMAFANMAWPILVILIGLMKMTRGMCKCDMPKM